MQESYGEGLATRTGPESRAAVREALTGGRAGQVFSRERSLLREADAVEGSGRPHRGVDIARRPRVPRGQRPRACPDTPRARTGRARGRPTWMARRAASGSLSLHAKGLNLNHGRITGGQQTMRKIRPRRMGKPGCEHATAAFTVRKVSEAEFAPAEWADRFPEGSAPASTARTPRSSASAAGA